MILLTASSFFPLRTTLRLRPLLRFLQKRDSSSIRGRLFPFSIHIHRKPTHNLYFALTHNLTPTFPHSLTSKAQDLQAAFRDPSSPFHIPAGQSGPSSPDAPPPTHDHAATSNAYSYCANVNASLPTPSRHSRSLRHQQTLEQAKECLREWGYDPMSFWEQRIVWGDHDAFKWVLSLLGLDEGVLTGGNV